MNKDKLHKIADEIRADIIDMVYKAKDGHPGPSFSAVDIITTLYFNGIINVKPNEPQWSERDRFVLSKGHACPALYAGLARKGFFPLSELQTLRQINSRLQGHPDMNKTPGIDSGTGALGNGLAMAMGIALGVRYQQLESRVFVLTGDGEFEEGVIWETLLAAVKHKLSNLIVFMDNNKFQSGGSLDEISNLKPILPKLESFGWFCQQIDGHDFNAITEAVRKTENSEVPSFILCSTIKGKGLDFMEGNNAWHKKVPTDEEYTEAMSVLRRSEN